MKSAAFFWLVLLVVFLIAEAACPIHLVSIWFALGALTALLCAALGAPVWLQITLFVAVSGILLSRCSSAYCRSVSVIAPAPFLCPRKG